MLIRNVHGAVPHRWSGTESQTVRARSAPSFYQWEDHNSGRGPVKSEYLILTRAWEKGMKGQRKPFPEGLRETGRDLTFFVSPEVAENDMALILMGR